MAKRLGWYYSLPIFNFELPEGTESDSSYDTFYSGSHNGSVGEYYYFAGVNFDGEAAGNVVWSQEWVPVTSDPAPDTAQPYGANPGMLSVAPSATIVFQTKVSGTLTLSASVGGIPIPGKLVLVLDATDGLYGSSSWSYVADSGPEVGSLTKTNYITAVGPAGFTYSISS